MKFLKGLFGRKQEIRPIDITKRFDLINRVGQGSMSKVWRARDTESHEIVALKVLDKAKTRQLEERFKGLSKPSEGELAVELDHPNIVRTLEHGLTREKEQFLVMEFVEGASLSFVVDAQNDAMLQHRMKFILELGEAIEYLHKQGYIHRDICPRNVLLDSDNNIKLIDFGLVVPNTPAFQSPGNRTGTTSYMAPELVKRQRTDQRIDIFSYAVTCFEMFANKRPWDSENVKMDHAVQRINKPPIDILDLVPEIESTVAKTIMKGLRVDPDNRWKSMTEMLKSFRQARTTVGVKGSGTNPDTARPTDDDVPLS